MHARLKPMSHRFNYRVFNILIDLDQLNEAGKGTWLFSVDRINFVSFHTRDHIDGDTPTLRAYVDGLLARAGLAERPARVLLACYPRVFGQVFNPLSVYYAFDAEGSVVALIYEVRNTFGERHTYVCPVEPGQSSDAGIRQERAKLFHVSPFIGMEMRYHFRMRPPGETMHWRILETDRDGPLLSATYSGRRLEMTSRTLANCLLRIPFQTWKIIVGIHFEALRLWFKGARYIPRSAPPAKVSFEDAAPDINDPDRPRDGRAGKHCKRTA